MCSVTTQSAVVPLKYELAEAKMACVITYVEFLPEGIFG